MFEYFMNRNTLFDDYLIYAYLKYAHYWITDFIAESIIDLIFLF